MNHSSKGFTRSDQLEKLLARELALLISQHFPSKKFGLVSVSWIKIASGFDSAKAGISVMRNAHQFDDIAKKVIGKIQAELNHKLVMKKVPRIILELDRSTELLNKLENLEV